MKQNKTPSQAVTLHFPVLDLDPTLSFDLAGTNAMGDQSVTPGIPFTCLCTSSSIFWWQVAGPLLDVHQKFLGMTCGGISTPVPSPLGQSISEECALRQFLKLRPGMKMYSPSLRAALLAVFPSGYHFPSHSGAVLQPPEKLRDLNGHLRIFLVVRGWGGYPIKVHGNMGRRLTPFPYLFTPKALLSSL